MKNLSEFINLSVSEQLQELRVPKPNPQVREAYREAEKFVDAFVEGAVHMKEFLGGNTLPYLDAIELNQAVLCEECRFITREQTGTCPMCGGTKLTDLSKLISPLDAVRKDN